MTLLRETKQDRGFGANSRLGVGGAISPDPAAASPASEGPPHADLAYVRPTSIMCQAPQRTAHPFLHRRLLSAIGVSKTLGLEVGMHAGMRLLRLAACTLVTVSLASCLAPYKKYSRVSPKHIDEYYSASPNRPFEEIRRLSITFREVGYFTGRGSDEALIAMLKDKAAALGADAILDIRVSSQPAGAGEWNLIWSATALAIRYTAETRQHATQPSTDLPPSITATGTGFLIAADGVFLTANHVVAGSKSISVRVGGQAYLATVLGRDPVNDVAVLKLSYRGTPLLLASSRAVKLGVEVLTLGFPNVNLQGTSPKLTRGSISALTGVNDDPRHFQISVPVQPGNSGGALVNMHGEVVGLVISKLNDFAALQQTGTLPQSVNYAIKSDYIIAFLGTLGITPPVSETVAAGPTLDEVVRRLEEASGLILVEGAADRR